jgi:shikimate kinase
MSERRIVIVGFMGSGKTTVAKALAKRLECEMIDLDSFITEREGRSPAEIIRAEGEPFFREIESLALSEVLQNRAVRIVALGGGTWTIPANRTLIALHDCQSVWLDAPFEVCWERIATSGNAGRPLAPDRETTERLYESRRENYQLASVRIHVNESDLPETLANRILTETP